jgi:hypothetical protein
MAKPDEPENSEGDFSVNVDLGLGDLIPKEVVQQAYKDGVSGAGPYHQGPHRTPNWPTARAKSFTSGLGSAW